MAACQGGRLVVHFTNRKNAPLLYFHITRDATPSVEWIISSTSGLAMREVFRAERTTALLFPPPLRSGPFVLGWAAYQIIRSPDVAVERYADGWIGPKADLWISEDRLPATLLVSGRSLLPPTVAYPMRVWLTTDSRQLAQSTLHGPGAFELRFPVEAAGSGTSLQARRLEIHADRSFVPARAGQGTDPRELSIIIDRIGLTDRGDHGRPGE